MAKKAEPNEELFNLTFDLCQKYRWGKKILQINDSADEIELLTVKVQSKDGLNLLSNEADEDPNGLKNSNEADEDPNGLEISLADLSLDAESDLKASPENSHGPSAGTNIWNERQLPSQSSSPGSVNGGKRGSELDVSSDDSFLNESVFDRLQKNKYLQFNKSMELDNEKENISPRNNLMGTPSNGGVLDKRPGAPRTADIPRQRRKFVVYSSDEDMDGIVQSADVVASIPKEREIVDLEYVDQQLQLADSCSLEVHEEQDSVEELEFKDSSSGEEVEFDDSYQSSTPIDLATTQSEESGDDLSISDVIEIISSDMDDEEPRRKGRTCRRKKHSFAPQVSSAVDQSPSSHEEKATARRRFARQRQKLTEHYFADFNEHAFGNKLPSDMEIKWNKRLQSTAGLTRTFKRGATEYMAKIALSVKVIDTEAKLRSTLLHEMCHAAQWVISHSNKPPHGPVFRKWADAGEAAYPDLKVTTCHQYEIHFKFQWKCTNDSCGVVIKRHRKCIDEKRQVCGRCRSKLYFLEEVSSESTKSKQKEPTAWSMFLKDHSKAVKAKMQGASHGDVMKELSKMYKARN